jgi:alkylation response protein AidB-like acyl-CoA dehydrogenase
MQASSSIFRDEVRTGVQNVLLPARDDIERMDEFPESARVFAQEVVSASVPAEHGGRGVSLLDLCFAMEAVSYVCPALAPYVEAGLLFNECVRLSNHPMSGPILQRIAAGRLGAFALTDENSGSSPRQMRTTAEKRADGIFITGKKRHITFVDAADYLVCFAIDTTANNEITGYMFERPFTNISLSKRSEWMGLRGHRSWEVVFQAAQPAFALSPPGQGFSLAMQVLTKTRVSLASGFVGLAQAATDCAVEFCKQRVSPDRPLWRNQGVSFPLADVQAEIDAARAMIEKAALIGDENGDVGVISAKAKLLAAQALRKAVAVCCATLGGEAGNSSNRSGQMVQDAYTWIAAQGTENILRILVARDLFSE